MSRRHSQRTYDHRLVQLVRETGDVTLAIRHGVPRSTASGWTRRQPSEVVTISKTEARERELRVRLVRLDRRVRRLEGMLRLLLALFQVLQPDIGRLRVPRAADKTRLLRAIDRARGVLGLTRALQILRLSPSRLNAWRRAAAACELDDASSCPHAAPQRLEPGEIANIRDMVTAPEFRHVPTGRLAVLAQRLARVFASSTTWHRLARERGWRKGRGRRGDSGSKRTGWPDALSAPDFRRSTCRQDRGICCVDTQTGASQRPQRLALGPSSAHSGASLGVADEEEARAQAA